MPGNIVDDEAWECRLDDPRMTKTGERWVCADDADADDLRLAASLIGERTGLADRLNNLAYKLEQPVVARRTPTGASNG